MNPLFSARRGSSLWRPIVAGVTAVAVGLLSPSLNAQPAKTGVKPVTVSGPGGDVALPLVSVGREVGWRIGPEDYRLLVPQAASGRETRVEVLSPEINLNDYYNQRNRSTYYGDELYGKNARVVTVFTLSTQAGRTISNANFGPEDPSALNLEPYQPELLAGNAPQGPIKRRYSSGGAHTVAELFRGALPAGTYPLSVVSNGLGKNSYQVRASSGIRVEASQFTVNTRGQYNRDQLVSFIGISSQAVGKTLKLENYDADGPRELVLTLVSPKGERRLLTPSADTQWAADSLKITRNMVGTWKVQARILPTTKQFSNSFAIRLTLDGQKLFAQMPGFKLPGDKPQTPPPPPKPQLKLRPLTVTVVDTELKPIPGASYTLTGGTGTRTAQPVLPQGWVPVRAEVLSGDGVIESPTKMRASYGALRFVARRLQGALEVQANALLCNTVSSVPVSYSLTRDGSNSMAKPGETRMALEPGRYTLTPETVAGASTRPVKVEIQDGQVSRVRLEYRVETQLTLEPKALELTVGEGATVSTRVSTNFSNAGNGKLSLTLPAGLNATGPITVEGPLKANQPVTLTVPVQAVAPVEGSISATFNGGCATASSSVIVKPAPVKPVQLTLTKTVNTPTAKPGDAVVFTITVRNTGEALAKGVNLVDVLPEGLDGQPLNEQFDLQSGASREFQLPAIVTAKQSGTLTNTASLEWATGKLQASASVSIEVPVAVTPPPAPQPAPPPPTPPTPPAPEPKADLSVVKTVSSIRAKAGDTVTYTITVRNEGPDDAEVATLEDALPEGLELIGVQSSSGDVFSGELLLVDFGTLAKGASATVTVTAKVTANRDQGIVNTATVQSSTEDPNPANNASSAVLLVDAPAVVTPPAPPAKAKLTLNAVAISCGDRITLPDVAYTLNNQASTAKTLELEAGTYTITPEALPGASSQPITVTLAPGEERNVTLEYTTQLEVTLEPVSSNLNVGEITALTAVVRTDFPYALPVSGQFSLPANLESSDALAFQGTVKASDPFVALVSVTAKQAGAGQAQVSLAQACNLNATSSIDVSAPPAVARVQSRESEIVMQARLANALSGGYVVLAAQLPKGSQYIPGSSRAYRDANLGVPEKPENGSWPTQTERPTDAIGDPVVSGDWLYWILPIERDRLQYGVTYRLAHTGKIEVPEDCDALILISPGRSAGTPRPNVLPANHPFAKQVGMGDVVLLQGDAAALEALPKAVTLDATNAQRPVGGPATRLVVHPLRLSSDPADQPGLIVEAFDADGLPANDAFVTLEVNPEPATPDAAPDQAGYQVKLEKGVGSVRLTTLGGTEARDPVREVTVRATIRNANGVIASNDRYSPTDFLATLDPTDLNPTSPDRSAIALGIVVLEGRLDTSSGAFSASGALKGFARLPLGAWLLTVGTNVEAELTPTFSTAGKLLPPANPFDRFPLVGDSSTTGSDVRSSDSFYAKLELDGSYLLYGQFTPGFTGLISNYSPAFNGAQALYRAAGFRATGFAALVPNADRSVRLRGDGTSVYRVPGSDAPITEGSEQVRVVSFDQSNPSLRVRERQLVRGQDYTIDYLSGTVVLRAGLLSVDASNNPQFVEISYASDSSAVERSLRYGAQASIGSNQEGLELTGTVIGYRVPATTGSTAGNLFSVGVNYRATGLTFGVEGGVSGTGLGLASRLEFGLGGLQGQVRYQELWLGYVNPNSGQAESGRALSAGLTWNATGGFGFAANFAHNQNFTTGTADNTADASLRFRFGSLGASLGVAAKLNYAGGVNTQTDLFGTVGLEVPLGPLRFGAVQRIPFSRGTFGQTELSLEYAIAPNIGLSLRDTLTYAPEGVRQNLSLGARGSFSNAELLRTGIAPNGAPEALGTTNISANYDLASTDGNAGRARIGLETTIPLGTNWSTSLGGEALFTPNQPITGSASLGLRYQDKPFQASTRAQIGFTPQGIKQVYTFGAILPAGTDFVISPSLEYTSLPTFETRQDGVTVRDGGRFSVAAAYRGDDWSVLTNHTGRFGFLAPKGDVIEGELQTGWQAAERFTLRAGVGYRLQSGFAWQVGAGVNWWVLDWLALGANGSYYQKPSDSTSQVSFGLEGSLKLLDGLLFSAGYNFLGFQSGIGSFISTPGVYVRLEWKFDERTLGFNR